MAIASRSCQKRSMAAKVSSRLYTRVLEDCKLRRKVGLCVHGHIYCSSSLQQPEYIASHFYVGTPNATLSRDDRTVCHLY